MAHAADGCDEALLPRARAAARDRPSTSGRSFAAVASAALALGGIASFAAFAGTSSLGHPTARASLGSARDGDPALRVPSAHRGGAKPPVFVVSSVDPGEDAAFDAFKRDVPRFNGFFHGVATIVRHARRARRAQQRELGRERRRGERGDGRVGRVEQQQAVARAHRAQDGREFIVNGRFWRSCLLAQLARRRNQR